MTSGSHQPPQPKRVVPARRAPRSALRALTATVLAAAVGLLSVTPALAAPDGDNDGGLWYYTKTGIADLHAQGITGQGVTVAVIDSPINPNVPELQGANLTIHEPSYCQWGAGREGPKGQPRPATDQSHAARHGTSMTSLIVGNGDGGGGQAGVRGVAPQAHLLYYNAVEEYAGDSSLTVCRQGPDNADNDASVAQAIQQAVADGADIISISLGAGGAGDLNAAIAHAVGTGVIVVSGIPNFDDKSAIGAGGGLEDSNGVLTMQRASPDGQVDPDNAAVTESIDAVAPGTAVLGLSVSDDGVWGHRLASGTSDATAITSGVLALIMSAHPEATGNQALQALLRNTQDTDHPFVKDASGMWGYGVINPTRAVAADPTQYPDENPLISDDVLAMPTRAEIEAWANGGTPAASPAATPNANPTPSQSIVAGEDVQSTGTGTALWLVVGVAAVAVVAVAALIIVLMRSRRSRAPAAGSYESTSGPPPPAPQVGGPPVGGPPAGGPPASGPPPPAQW